MGIWQGERRGTRSAGLELAEAVYSLYPKWILQGLGSVGILTTIPVCKLGPLLLLLSF